MNKFSDFSQEQTPLEGEKMKLDEVINREIIVCSFKISNSKYTENKSGKYVTIQIKFHDTDTPKIIFTGSDVLANQCQKYQDHMPFATTIRKINKYYTFT